MILEVACRRAWTIRECSFARTSAAHNSKRGNVWFCPAAQLGIWKQVAESVRFQMDPRIWRTQRAISEGVLLYSGIWRQCVPTDAAIGDHRNLSCEF